MNSRWKLNLNEAKGNASAARSPVALFIYNRAELSAELIRCIRVVQPRRLLLVADGPRANRVGDAEACALTRRVVLDAIDWETELTTNFADENMGLRRRVSSGLDWVFSQVSEAIILEDDLRPHSDFFRFCDDLLEYHREDERIGAISGNCYYPNAGAEGVTHYASIYPFCWGWATWKRAWQNYDHELTHWPKWRDAGDGLAAWLEDSREVDFWKNALGRVERGEVSSWAFVWLVSLWRHQMLTILPCRNLVSNMGFGNDASNTNDTNSPHAALAIFPMPFPLIHPPRLARFREADAWSARNVFGIG